MHRGTSEVSAAGILPIRRCAQLLGYAGLIPFAAIAVAIWVGPARDAALWAGLMVNYAAVIVTFVGAVHWGRQLGFIEAATDGAAGLSAQADSGLLVWAVTPSLVAWVALALPHALALVLLAIALILCLWVDLRVYRDTALQRWYLRVRLRLSCGALLAILLTLSRPLFTGAA